MKYACMFVLLIFCSSHVLCSSDDKLVETIENCDPEGLRDLLIPGYLMSLDAKNKYVKLAQEITNQTYAELHQFKLKDIGGCIKALAYGALGSSFLALAADYCILKKLGIKEFLLRWGRFGFTYGPPQAPVEGQTAEPAISERDETIFGGSLAAFGLYFFGKSLSLFHRVITKQNRVKTHHDALTVEAMIQRLPAFDNGCFVPGSSS